MRKIKISNYVDESQDKIVSTGFKVRESVLADFREAQKQFKESTNTTFKFREVLEDVLVDLTAQLKEAAKAEDKGD